MNNNDLFQASRRRFLAQLGGLTVAGMLGPSLLTPRRATATQAATEAVISKEGILTGYLPYPDASFNVAQDSAGFLGCEGTLLAHV